MDPSPGGSLSHGAFDKVDVVQQLARLYGYTRYQQLEYCTVDADFGCGVIIKQPASSKPRATPAFGALGSEGEQQLAAAWYALGSDFAATYTFFGRHRETLLRLVSIEAFRAALAR